MMAAPAVLRTDQPARGDDLSTPALRANLGILADWEAELARILLSEGQGHLFENWPPPLNADADKHRFFKQVQKLDASYPGGLRAYISNARKLLQESRDGVNPFDGWTPSVPSGEVLTYGNTAFSRYEAEGVRQANDAAFVLVAGGLGERLGYSGIKVALPSNIVTDASFLQTYVESILALQDASNAVAEDRDDGCQCLPGVCPPQWTSFFPARTVPSGPRRIPFAIMTSDDTHARTQKLLEEHAYFGMDKDQITLIKQEKVACLADNSASLALDPDDKFRILTKPHGHGDVHSLLYSSGLLKDWQAKGVKWILFFQDTNGLIFKAVPSSLGVSATRSYDVNSLAVPRKAKEAIGGITRLTHKDGRKIVINVEYNQLDPMLRSSGYPDGDVNDPSTGFSPYPGNINQLVIKLESYVKELSKTRGLVPEFVNPKYKDSSRTSFKSPTRLESLMQDYPKSLSPSADIGFTVLDVWLGYAPVKNNPEDAAAKLAAGTPPHSATSGEAALYRANCLILRAAGAKVADPRTVRYNDQETEMWPRVVWSPKWALTLADVKAKVRGASVEIAQDAVLILDGPEIYLEAMKLDGALVIRSKEGAKVRVAGLDVRNKGWTFQSIGWQDRREPEELRVRGYKLVKREQKEIEFDKPGEFVVSH
ncbi:UTP--glucose-1-phosphate uridylyltransferase [Klebsormidium nitens]|uniref:UTP-monosaccharide-1-phosphate uridylyltransferase n=1 Tax=Klebsormidium nitens TaxID=105231 RepID=A0A1Y1IC08_KLENI|nr:UTP--glucose-1-phosphate uridylyltransferase [Klebsormidium nitens]|eukprot:GAQ87502.1 UTP--glucose-1-phosphate uridylyltransferase [Klebsormidium nitens]